MDVLPRRDALIGRFKRTLRDEARLTERKAINLVFSKLSVKRSRRSTSFARYIRTLERYISSFSRALTVQRSLAIMMATTLATITLFTAARKSCGLSKPLSTVV